MSEIETTDATCPECGTTAAVEKENEHGERFTWCIPDEPNDGDYCGHAEDLNA